MAGRSARNLVIVVLVVFVLLLVADRVGLVIAERAAGDTIASSQHLGSRPDVTVTGFPFLTQLATGKYDEIVVTANNVPIGRPKPVLDLSRLRVVLHSLTVSRDFSSVRAKSANATALITYAELDHVLGATIAYAGGGEIKARKTVSVAGHSFGASLRVRPQLLNGALSFAGTSLLSIPLRGIPFRIQLQSLNATPRGLQIALVGHNLAYHS